MLNEMLQDFTRMCVCVFMYFILERSVSEDERISSEHTIILLLIFVLIFAAHYCSCVANAVMTLSYGQNVGYGVDYDDLLEDKKVVWGSVSSF